MEKGGCRRGIRARSRERERDIVCVCVCQRYIKKPQSYLENNGPKKIKPASDDETRLTSFRNVWFRSCVCDDNIIRERIILYCTHYMATYPWKYIIGPIVIFGYYRRRRRRCEIDILLFFLLRSRSFFRACVFFFLSAFRVFRHDGRDLVVGTSCDRTAADDRLTGRFVFSPIIIIIYNTVILCSILWRLHIIIIIITTARRWRRRGTYRVFKQVRVLAEAVNLAFSGFCSGEGPTFFKTMS